MLLISVHKPKPLDEDFAAICSLLFVLSIFVLITRKYLLHTGLA